MTAGSTWNIEFHIFKFIWQILNFVKNYYRHHNHIYLLELSLQDLNEDKLEQHKEISQLRHRHCEHCQQHSTFGDKAKSITATPKGIRASGNPIRLAASIAFIVLAQAAGFARTNIFIGNDQQSSFNRI